MCQVLMQISTPLAIAETATAMLCSARRHHKESREMVDLDFTPRSFELLEELAANNEKTWYDEHRDELQTYLRKPFAVVLELATDRLAETAVPFVGGAKTMFRQHRDIRFSKDKSPYSTHISGLLMPSGTKA
jgi:uncharacterized protein (TIGR02453 family)